MLALIGLIWYDCFAFSLVVCFLIVVFGSFMIGLRVVYGILWDVWGCLFVIVSCCLVDVSVLYGFQV